METFLCLVFPNLPPCRMVSPPYAVVNLSRDHHQGGGCANRTSPLCQQDSVLGGWDPTQILSGHMDEVRIWDTVRTPQAQCLPGGLIVRLFVFSFACVLVFLLLLLLCCCNCFCAEYYI